MEVENPIELETFPTPKLLGLYGALLDELRRRGVVRSSNNPLSDYAEGLFCKAFGWAQEGNSAAGYDAVDAANGTRYQIKGRRLTAHNASRQLSAIRNLDDHPFHFLAGLLVDARFQIVRAAIIPFDVVKAQAARVEHTNSWKFMLRNSVWELDGVCDVTDELREAAAAPDDRFERGTLSAQ